MLIPQVHFEDNRSIKEITFFLYPGLHPQPHSPSTTCRVSLSRTNNPLRFETKITINTSVKLTICYSYWMKGSKGEEGFQDIFGDE